MHGRNCFILNIVKKIRIKIIYNKKFIILTKLFVFLIKLYFAIKRETNVGVADIMYFLVPLPTRVQLFAPLLTVCVHIFYCRYAVF